VNELNDANITEQEFFQQLF